VGALSASRFAYPTKMANRKAGRSRPHLEDLDLDALRTRLRKMSDETTAGLRQGRTLHDLAIRQHWEAAAADVRSPASGGSRRMGKKTSQKSNDNLSEFNDWRPRQGSVNGACALGDNSL
jgi:hypothetical protein